MLAFGQEMHCHSLDVVIGERLRGVFWTASKLQLECAQSCYVYALAPLQMLFQDIHKLSYDQHHVGLGGRAVVFNLFLHLQSLYGGVVYGARHVLTLGGLTVGKYHLVFHIHCL